MTQTTSTRPHPDEDNMNDHANAAKQSDAIQTTPLFALHQALGGKMVPFAGYHMPVQYPDGILKEHLHTREQAGLFDVSHMGQVVIKGAGLAQALEKLIPVDLESLNINQQTYAVLTNKDGGILDDLIVTRWAEDTFFLVVNAACKEQDLSHLLTHLHGFEFEYLNGQGLMALQGPAATHVMEQLSPEANKLTFMNGCHTQISGKRCYVTRSGYTGEDGFEISVDGHDAEALAKTLLSFDAVEPIGLGARDSLRLEAGLCLYGHDMDTKTTPIEASLLWSISQSRRPEGAKAGGFLGAERIFQQINDGVSTKRVGFEIEGRAPIREGAEIVNETGAVIGKITSGGFGPTLNQPVAMGYVPKAFATVGTKLSAMVRGKARPITVCKMPFVPQRYFRG